MTQPSQLPDPIRKPLLALIMVSFAGTGGLMALITLFVVVISLWTSVSQLSYWDWISAPAVVVRHTTSEQPRSHRSPRSRMYCAVIRFSDRTGKPYEVNSTCVTVYGSPRRRGGGSSFRSPYWKGQAVTVWYDPDHPAQTLIAEQKPYFNPLEAINWLSIFFGTLTIGLFLGAKMARDELQAPKN
ncbi:DUF3592 domain-containing protein [Pantanalinema rosaneae CENA516]|uniref:DUF3592 domain-containing protein n=1 Tax=Pantanalinema rosaneae TaxID=1620701 RepID=UPI003D6EB70C